MCFVSSNYSSSDAFLPQHPKRFQQLRRFPLFEVGCVTQDVIQKDDPPYAVTDVSHFLSHKRHNSLQRTPHHTRLRLLKTFPTFLRMDGSIKKRF